MCNYRNRAGNQTKRQVATTASHGKACTLWHLAVASLVDPKKVQIVPELAWGPRPHCSALARALHTGKLTATLIVHLLPNTIIMDTTPLHAHSPP